MRNTPLLQSVLELLKNAHKPMSVPDLQAELTKSSQTPNKTTLYRMLEKLNEAGTVETLLLDPKVTYYELKTHHHHHFKCNDCSTIECLTDPKLEAQIHKLEDQLKEKGISIEAHHFSLSGKCKDCT